MNLWKNIAGAFNGMSESLPWKKGADVKSRRSSLEEIEGHLYDIAVINKGARDYKESMVKKGIKEPFSDHPEFFNDHSVMKTFQVPRLFCKDILGNPAVNAQILEPEWDMSVHIDKIMKAFTYSVDTLYLVCGKNAQGLLEGTLKSDLFYEVYEASSPKKQEDARVSMDWLIEMSHLPKAGHCPEDVVSQLCNSKVICAMLRDAEPEMAADILKNMFHKYKPDEAAARIKDSPIIALLPPSEELALALRMRSLPYEFIGTVMNNAGSQIKPEAEQDNVLRAG